METSDRITYRRSTADDAEAVFALVGASVRTLSPDPYPREVVATWMAGRASDDYLEDCRNQQIWIAELGSVPIGFAHGVPGELKRLFVDADHAGRGVGAALLERALRDTTPDGHGIVKIEATLNAAPFYEKWGFKEVGRSVFPGRDEGLPQIDVIVMSNDR
ncbi:GNAT family N-acetyltransferase [Roseibium aggregatum]|uniref:GNAT family N-acetyltransferase n=1 Tax=Roseibium aggregatum TaxID=187304 RepID=A0A939EF30_9HYPH|nr:GNAT family N-acetyltransferase [Roseibium aggregatum]MBN9670630.1 GNAT family N-acetyltransferase [Roseibium aggregatum]